MPISRHKSFKTCPYDAKSNIGPKDTINNQVDLFQNIVSVHGDMDGKGQFVFKNNDYFEGKKFVTAVTVTQNMNK